MKTEDYNKKMSKLIKSMKETNLEINQLKKKLDLTYGYKSDIKLQMYALDSEYYNEHAKYKKGTKVIYNGEEYEIDSININCSSPEKIMYNVGEHLLLSEDFITGLIVNSTTQTI